MKDLCRKQALCTITLCVLLASCERSQVPHVSTTDVTNITANSAQSGGIILSDGGEDILSCGLCWDTVYCPTVLDPGTPEATRDSVRLEAVRTGEFKSKMNSLIPGKTYHVRAYATSINGTAYGEDIAFSTLTGLPFCILTSSDFDVPYHECYSTYGTWVVGYVWAGFLPTRVTLEIGRRTKNGIEFTDFLNPSNTGNARIDGNDPVLVYFFCAENGPLYYRIKAQNDAGIAYSEEQFKDEIIYPNSGDIYFPDGSGK